MAQKEIPLGGPLEGIGRLGQFEPGEAPRILTKFISSAIGLMTIIAIIWFVFLLITGAIGIISSGGDKASLESSHKRITTGLIGLIVVIAAIFIIRFIGKLIGIPNILDLPVLFEQIQE